MLNLFAAADIYCSAFSVFYYNFTDEYFSFMSCKHAN